MNVLFIGDVGVGKSSLINACRHPLETRKAKTGKEASGVTKKFSDYRLKDVGDLKVYGIDAIGVGDFSQNMNSFVANVEQVAKKFPLHAICLLNNCVTGRVGLAAQITAKIINLGILKYDKEAADRVVITGTMGDLSLNRDGSFPDPDDIQAWENKVVPGFGQFLGCPPRHVCWTGVPKFGAPHVSNLTAKLKEIGNAVSLQMKEVENKAFVDFLKNNTGFDMGSAEEMAQLNQEIIDARMKAKEELAKIQAKVQADLAAAAKKAAEERAEAQRIKEEQLRLAEARRVADLAAEENKRQAAALSYERNMASVQEDHARELRRVEESAAQARQEKTKQQTWWIHGMDLEEKNEQKIVNIAREDSLKYLTQLGNGDPLHSVGKKVKVGNFKERDQVDLYRIVSMKKNTRKDGKVFYDGVVQRFKPY